MSVYLGNEKVKVNIGGKRYKLNLYSKTPITNGVRLITKDGKVLKDANGLYITTKEQN